VVGGGAGATGGWRARAAEGRPNWWVILAVSLALMALLVATSPAPDRAPRHVATSAPGSDGRPSARRGPPTGTGHPGGRALGTTTTTALTATTVTGAPPDTAPSGSALTSDRRGLGGSTGAAPAAPASVSTTTTTTAPAAAGSPAVPADRTQTQGYLDPPLTTSNTFAFTGLGAMEISAVWSGATYLTMEVDCPGASQNAGGSGAMATTLVDASGSCTATVSEPSTESVPLSYTMAIGPAGG